MGNNGRALLLALAVMVPISVARAQGCSQCRDTVSQTGAAQQQSYRTAIGIMLAGVLSVVGASVFVIRRFSE